MAMTQEQWPRIKAILDAALALDGADRQSYVDAACSGDARLRQEIDSLILAHDRSAGFLEQPPSLAPFLDRGPGEPIGRVAGPYRVLSLVGAGGMGEVYLAHDSKLDRRVALKLLPRDVAADPERLRRFHQEARAASSLNHPHILVIHDFGELDGRPFIVSEFVEGETLRERLRRGPLAPGEAVDIALQVAGALGAAHARGIVHRDVKPENIMLRPDGHLKVVDFGLAKLVGPDAAAGAGDAGAGTRVGLLLGTPRYMSPEQARGQPLDARSDIWSLGVILYEMIAGRPPFAGATPADAISAIVGREPMPIVLQAPAVPGALERVITRALQKAPGDRHANAADIAAALTAVRKQLESDAPRSPLLAGAADAEDIATPRRALAPRTRLIVLPFRMLRADADIEFMAFSLADAIATTLSGLDTMIVRSSMTAARFAAEPLDLEALATQAEVDAVLTGTLLRTGAQLRVNAQLLTAPQGTIIWSERVDVPAEDLIRVHDELTDRIVDSVSLPLTSRDQRMLRRDSPASAKAYELYLRGNHHFYDSEQWTVARDLFVECVREDPGYAPAWARLGRCFRLTAKFRSDTVAEMRENLGRAEAAFRKAFELNPDLPLAHHLYTPLETDLGRAEDAMLRLVRRARQRRADPELFAGLVHACRYCGLLDESIAAHERARQLDPHVQTGIANTYWMRGEYGRAEGFTGFFVGLPLVSLGRYEEAIAAARASAAVVRDPITRSYQSIFPLLLEGRTVECAALLDALAPRNPDPESIYHIARTYARLGALDRAIAQFERAVDGGFACCEAFARDGWLDPVRGDRRFEDAMARAGARRARSADRFGEAGGRRLLGLA
ncbi:MAG: FlgO family outer membrane protein [Betaproteobacteria bacterium]